MNVINAFKQIETDQLTIIKEGNVKGIINASVQKNEIFTHDVSVPIEKDDIFVRKIFNGVEEKYRVVNPNFYKGIATMPSHYEVEVQKLGIDKLNDYNNIYNVSAEKVNINSVDNSLNIKNDCEFFNDMIKILDKANVDNKNEILDAINEMKNNYGKPSFKDKVNDFLQIVGNCITLFKTIIPFLIK